jgi:nitrite reductase (NO-forming)
MGKYLSFLGGVLMVVASACGGSNKQAESGSQASTPASGEDIYKRACASCHMGSGDGIANVYPPLAKSDYLTDREKTIHQVIKGSSGPMTVNGKEYNNTMPPQQLTDDEVAAVLTYVYTNMGNTGTAVTPAEVKAVREKP